MTYSKTNSEGFTLLLIERIGSYMRENIALEEKIKVLEVQRQTLLDLLAEQRPVRGRITSLRWGGRR